MKQPVLYLTLASFTIASCAMEESADLGSSEQLGRKINGRKINGRKINGRKINGTSLNAMVISANLSGVRINGSVVDASLAAGEFSSGSLLGDDFLGANFTANLDDGGTIPLRIDDIVPVAADLNHYAVSYQTADGWFPLCGSDAAGVPIAAIPLSGVWNYGEGVAGGGSHSAVPTQFTFACNDAALGKCVNYGYVPWRSSNGTSLQAQHQSCTRALRADYCGDGRSWTADGQTINHYDSAGIATDTENWGIEAEWIPSGAVCMTRERVLQIQGLGGLLPSCLLAKLKLDCGAKSNLGKRALQMTEMKLGLLGL